VGLLRFFLWARWIVPVYSTCINRAPNVFFFNKILLLIKKKKKKVMLSFFHYHLKIIPHYIFLSFFLWLIQIPITL
jgi:hypothetical protein